MQILSSHDTALVLLEGGSEDGLEGRLVWLPIGLEVRMLVRVQIASFWDGNKLLDA